MERLLIVYFSGTGNTRYVAEKMAEQMGIERAVSIEEDVDFEGLLRGCDRVMALYPIVGGNIPIIMREFARRYRVAFYGKNLITIVTEAGFSGDGGALFWRYLASEKVEYLASYHIIMPTNVSFGKVFAIKNGDAIKGRIAKVNRKIETIANGIKNGHYKKVGRGRLSYMLGYHLQRKYFDRIEEKLRQKFSVDSASCIKCKRCVSLCPMHNIVYQNGKIEGLGKCTLCYRCLHACPTNSISLIRHEPVQYKGVGSAIQ